MSLFDQLDEGRQRRDAGMQLREANSPTWHHDARRHLQEFLNRYDGDEFTSDHIRGFFLQIGFEGPPHPNSWGALLNSAAKAGLVYDTGRVAKTIRAKGAARKITIWARSQVDRLATRQ